VALDIHARVQEVVAKLRERADPAFLADLQPRYGIIATNALGVRMADLKAQAKALRKDQDLAEALWQTGIYEARLLVSLIGDPQKISPDLADAWRAGLDNWAVTDTLCFNLFDRLPFAFDLVDRWAQLNDEQGKRAAFALLATLALHGRGSSADFVARLPLIQAAATDDRNFVKKGVSWALRAIGSKKDPDLRSRARALAQHLAESPDPSSRWIGRDALRAFKKADTQSVPLD
jgi:3-methyladenine DNA glycosylase AlkD